MAIQVENPARILDHGQEKPIVKFTLCDFILISLSLIVYVADIVTGEWVFIDSYKLSFF